jgi:hypothetical protein
MYISIVLAVSDSRVLFLERIHLKRLSLLRFLNMITSDLLPYSGRPCPHTRRL